MNMIRMFDFEVKASVLKASIFMIMFMGLIIVVHWLAWLFLFLFLGLACFSGYYVYKEWQEKKLNAKEKKAR